MVKGTTTTTNTRKHPRSSSSETSSTQIMSSSSSSSSNRRSNRKNRRVSFAPRAPVNERVTYHEIECIPEEYHFDCFYTPDELKTSQDRWLYSEPWQKKIRKMRHHATIVVTKFRGQRNRGRSLDVDELRQFSKQSSKKDRVHALTKGMEHHAAAQEEQQGHDNMTTKTTTTSSGTSSSVGGMKKGKGKRLRKTLSNSISAFQNRSPRRNRPSKEEVEATTNNNKKEIFANAA